MYDEVRREIEDPIGEQLQLVKCHERMEGNS